jgi:hypothetical protein
MALRFSLVCLVVTLGFELPNGEDAAARVRSGWNWVFGDDEVGSIRVTTELAVSPKSSDEEFAGIVDQMAHTFAADMARSARSAVTVHASPEIEVEEWSFEPLEEAKPVVATSTGQAVRLVSAIKLTQQAASAWADLFASVAESNPSQSGSHPLAEGGSEDPVVEESLRQSLTQWPTPAVSR